MRCVICGRECHEAFMNLGAYCCDEHRAEVLRRHRALLDELHAEDPLHMPEAFGVPDFDRFVLKLAVFLLDRIGPQVRELFRQQAPALLEPAEMALELKERVLRQLPASHVELEEAVGLARLFRGGTFTFRQPVPAPLVIEAIRRAGLLPLLGIVPGASEPGGEEADRGW